MKMNFLHVALSTLLPGVDLELPASALDALVEVGLQVLLLLLGLLLHLQFEVPRV